MNSLNIKETNQTPAIFFDLEKGLIRIEGKSYSDNVMEVYQPLFDYITTYAESPQKVTQLHFKWLYFNTSTSKIIANLILKLKIITNLEVKWYCKKEFSMMIEKGEEYGEMLDLNLEIILYE